MYACRTPEVDLRMAEFQDFFHDLESLVEKYGQKNTMLKVEHDFDNDIVKIFGEKISSLARAKNGISEVTELAYTTAEHHPYWNLLYNTSEIITTLLDNWKGNIEKDDISDIEWSLKEIAQTLEKIKKDSH